MEAAYECFDKLQVYVVHEATAYSMSVLYNEIGPKAVRKVLKVLPAVTVTIERQFNVKVLSPED